MAATDPKSEVAQLSPKNARSHVRNKEIHNPEGEMQLFPANDGDS